MTFSSLLLSLVVAVTPAAASVAAENGRDKLRAWSAMLDGSSDKGRDTPVTRVVGLLKEMASTVNKEQQEDEDLFHKLQCWCNDNDWAKSNAIEKSESKTAELQSTIESLTGSTAELAASIKELEAQFTADKKALVEATAIREKQLDEFHNMEKDQIQAVENLKAALTVLAKHHDAPPDSTVAGGAIFKSERDSWESFVQVHSSKDFPSETMRSFNNFMRRSGLDDISPSVEVPAVKPKFLQQQGAMSTETTWSADDADIVSRAVKSASAFVQARQGQGYYPAYQSQSGEIVGILKQLKEEMEADLSEAQKREMSRADAFAELRAAKTEEIESAEKMAESKEDQLASQRNELAEAKEDLTQEEASLSADQKFMKNLKETCTDADKNFQERKAARLEELTAISQTIGILTGDEARDAMSGTFNFMQVSASRKTETHRQKAAQTLRLAARVAQDPQLSMLATAVELDAFTKVKKAIDDMISMLRKQQEDEVKKSDWCKAELQSNEMTTAKADTKRADLEATIAKLEEDIRTLDAAIADAKAEIAETQLNLQRANEARKADNLDFQKVVADQTVTIEVLEKALDKLANYYDLVQTQGKSWIQRQTPDVVQATYSKNKGATGVMGMIEKLIYDSRELMAESKKSESTAQAAYEALIADSNRAIAALQRSIVSRTAEKADAMNDKRETESDHADTVKELEGLAKYNAELHTECDYLLNNFDVRQQGRMAEIEALQQAKQILNGASLS